ncbi:MAG: ribonuclease P protein component [Gemmatimonadota bacterium]
MPRARRITTRREIAHLLTGQRARADTLELYWRPAAGLLPRATCITPKHGHTGVERNQLRRRLKELMRQILFVRPDALDYLVRSRPPAYDRTYAQLADELTGLAAAIEPA